MREEVDGAEVEGVEEIVKVPGRGVSVLCGDKRSTVHRRV